MMQDVEVEKVIRWSEDIDSFLYSYLEANKNMHVLELISIVLARTAAVSEAVGCLPAYQKLLQGVLEICEMRQTANNDYGNYH